ncbi:MAG: hypothetical protein ACREMK_02355 [Gemmatimonadota bacterium]
MDETARGSFREWACKDSTPRDSRNRLRVLWVSLIWAVSFVAGAQLIKRDLLPAGPVSWVVAALPSAIAVLVLIAYARFLREADELQRMIQLKALALGFGGGFFAIAGLSLFERLGVHWLDMGDSLVVMPVLYSIGVVLGQWRYR